MAPANRVVGRPPSDVPAETLTLKTDSGSAISAWHWTSENSKATVILVHPIRGDRRSMLSRARMVHEAGYDALLIDLQAHGESPGENITMGYREKHDVRAAVEFVRQSKPDHAIVIIGHSLGGASALLASSLNIDGMVLESVYPTIGQAVHDRVEIRLGLLHHVLSPLLIWQLKGRLGISADDLRPIDFVDQVGCPLLMMAGDLDEHTPLAESEEMFERGVEPKEWAVFEGAGHVDLHSFDQEAYERAVLPFLERCIQTTVGLKR